MVATSLFLTAAAKCPVSSLTLFLSPLQVVSSNTASNENRIRFVYFIIGCFLSFACKYVSPFLSILAVPWFRFFSLLMQTANKCANAENDVFIRHSSCNNIVPCLLSAFHILWRGLGNGDSRQSRKGISRCASIGENHCCLPTCWLRGMI